MSAKKKLRLDQDEIVDPKDSYDNFNLSTLKDNLTIDIVSSNQECLQFEIKGIDAAIANALRRIMIAQVPTMAFHKVFLYQNTSVLPDELLVHRMGLLPIKIDCNQFKDRANDQELNQSNSLKFRLKIKCERKQEYKKMSQQELQSLKLTPQQYLINHSVYSKDLEWVPQGNQKVKLKNVRPVYQNILIAKLRQNQEIILQIYAEKGTGKQHSKWSPVSTVFYRLMPEITVTSDFNHEKYAQTLTQVCPGKVFALKKGKASVKNPKSCTTCRQCLKLDGIVLQKIKDHFLFTVESTGIMNPVQIFSRALDIMDEKSRAYSI